MKEFRASHPKRFHGPPSVSTSSVLSRRTHSTVMSNTERHAKVAMKSALNRHSRKQTVDATSNAPSQQSRNALNTLMDRRKTSKMSNGLSIETTGRRTKNKGLKELLNENHMYEDVVNQIKQRIALREAIDNASDALSRSHRSAA